MWHIRRSLLNEHAQLGSANLSQSTMNSKQPSLRSPTSNWAPVWQQSRHRPRCQHDTLTLLNYSVRTIRNERGIGSHSFERATALRRSHCNQ